MSEPRPPIRTLFTSDVTRDIPPVVYFSEQTPEKLQAELSEYIITGGWPEDHPNHRRVPNGIHEQYTRLLTAIASELDKPGGPELPAAWISGFYGSGKSSFAKLLGMALDGKALPDNTSVAEALLRRDTSPKAGELRAAWKRLRQKIDPIAVVFDVGGVARDNEQIHAAVLRQVQRRLGYCSTNALVADFELKLELDGEWARFEKTVPEVLGRPWAQAKDRQFAEEDFSLVLSVMYPQKYVDPMAWYMSRAGTHTRSESPEEAVKAIGDMLRHRSPSSTLFIVVDEVSQYVLSNKDRVDRLRAFATVLGATLKGKAWLLALGQQKLDEEADDSFLVWAKDRFPPKLRVHLSATNIRDVVHKRLLHKTPAAETQLRALFESHRASLKLHAYACNDITPDEFVETYPMLPGHIDLLLKITSALRTRSARAQGDAQAIRGLLQLLGELFRGQHLAELPVGALVTLEQIYEVQHTALDSDVQNSMTRVLAQCKDDAVGLMVRVAKAVSLLELIQEHDDMATTAKLVSQCLFDRVDRGNQLDVVTGALEELRRRNLLGYSEKTGYKLQSSAAEEWERERREIGVPRERIGELVQEGLKLLLEGPVKPRLRGRPFPWAGVFSDGRHLKDARLLDPRDSAVLRVDFRLLATKERIESTWIRKSAEDELKHRLVWLSGDGTQLETLCRRLLKSRAMVRKYKPRRESLSPPRKLLLTQEENNAELLLSKVRAAIGETWMSGRLYFDGRAFTPTDFRTAFGPTLSAVGELVLRDLYSQFDETQVQPSELKQLIQPELVGTSEKFLSKHLGIVELDAGRLVATCSGKVPRRICELIEADQGLGGTTLLARFGGPPYGYTANVIKACVMGLLRAGKLKIQPEAGPEITAIRDAGTADLVEKDRAFRRSNFFPAGDDGIGFRARAQICKFFKRLLGHSMDRENNAIADAVALLFPALASTQRSVVSRLARLPTRTPVPEAITALIDVLDRCIASSRQTEPTVKLVKRNLDVLRDGLKLQAIYAAELTPEAIEAVRGAHGVLSEHIAQLVSLGVNASNVDAAGARIAEHLTGKTPWRDIARLEDDLAQARAAYEVERRRLLGWQEQQVEAARAQIKGRDGFSTLTGEQSHHVLRPLSEALTATSLTATSPSLVDLRGDFSRRLSRAEELANERLDALLEDTVETVICSLSRQFAPRELNTEQDVEALVDEVKQTLMAAVREGKRVRLR